jgi:hypothetical protein
VGFGGGGAVAFVTNVVRNGNCSFLASKRLLVEVGATTSSIVYVSFFSAEEDFMRFGFQI